MARYRIKITPAQGVLIRSVMREMETTAAEFARSVNCSPSQISRYIRGMIGTPLYVAGKMYEFLDSDPRLGFLKAAQDDEPSRDKSQSIQSGDASISSYIALRSLHTECNRVFRKLGRDEKGNFLLEYAELIGTYEKPSPAADEHQVKL